MNDTLHPNLPALPLRMKKLPVDARGFPVPWFVEWFHADGKPFENIRLPISPGDYPDFRVVDARKMKLAYLAQRCWVCGDPLGRYMAFVIGPMCAVNRTSGEPPSHRECALFSARACPFLSKPGVVRRENNLPTQEKISVHPAMLDRNPGVTMVWLCHGYSVRRSEGTVLFTLGDPIEVLYFTEGRAATRAEIMHSIDTGMPFLREVAAQQGAEALQSLAESYTEALQLVPAA